MGLSEPFIDILSGNRIAKLLKHNHRLKGKSGIQDLIASCQRNLYLVKISPGKALFFISVMDILHFFHIQEFQGSPLLPCPFFQNLPGSGFLRRRYYLCIRLDDPGFLCGNFLQSISQKGHVVHTDGGDHFHYRRLNDIGSVQGSSKTGFQDHQITFFLLEIQERKGGFYFKRRRICKMMFLYIFNSFCNSCHMFRQGFFSDPLSVYLYPLSVGKQSRGNIPSYPVSRFCQYSRKISQDRTLSIGS